MNLHRILVSMAFACAVNAGADGSAPDVQLRDAIARVVERHPAFESAQFALTAAQAQARGAGLATPWVVEVDAENLGGTGSATGVDRFESTLSIARVLEFGGQARLRGVLGLDQASQLEAELAVERLDLIAATARRFLDVVEAQAKLGLAKQTHDLAQATATSIEKLASAAGASGAEEARAQMLSEVASLGHREAGHRLENTRYQLAAMWMGSPSEFARAEAALFDIAPPPAFEALLERLDEIPDLMRFASAERVAASRLALASAASRPDVTVSAGLRYLHDERDVGLVFNLAVPLGAPARAELGIAAARASHQRVALERARARQALAALLHDAYGAMYEAVHIVRDMQATVMPLAERALAGYRKGYEKGSYSLSDLFDAEHALLGVQRDMITHAMRYHRHRIEIERLTGGELFTGE